MTMPGAWIERQVRHGNLEFRDRDGVAVRLHYAEAGEGPLVVLLHGFPEYWYSWRYQIPALVEAGFRVVAPDQRGYALSSKPAGVRRYRDECLTDDVAALVRRLGDGRPATVVGHDWGGVVAWLFAQRHPELVAQLAVLNMPHPRAYLRGLCTSWQWLRSWYVLAFQLPWLPERALLAGDGALLRRTLRSGRGRVTARMRADEDLYLAAARQPGALTAALGYYRAAFRRLLVAPWRWWRARPVEAPTLVLWGEGDPYLDASTAPPPRDLVPDSRLVFLPGAGHWIQVQAPAEVNRHLLDFLATARAGSRGPERGKVDPAGGHRCDEPR